MTLTKNCLKLKKCRILSMLFFFTLTNVIYNIEGGNYMSKIYDKYVELKKQNFQKLYLFKSGIFYIALNEDAEKLANLFQFKITDLNGTATKCGFPEKRLDYYTNLLKATSIDFEIVDLNHKKQHDTLNDSKLNEIIQSISEIDLENLNLQSAFDILKKLQDDVNQLKQSKENT